ncbi:hypothetical protein LTR37_007583 [Vermiconidia calcicola]|uniref:Uncharacterized protein n=1 Tax=Vermiconidia calcicola TaxID=1690605 RepID=A0ACC3NEH0_9PEZI|nr:hypothetical protein LTR37_007583 [Vermiconidia calcicola]
MYSIEILVGTPGQPQSLQLDTGSRRMWIPAKGSSICSPSLVNCDSLGSFDRSKSSTFDSTGQTDTISYADGSSVTGESFYDTLRIGGQSVKRQIQVLGKQGSGVGEGVLGVGFPASAPTLNHNLAAQGIIESNKYSLWLNDLNAASGIIIFGGIDTAKFVPPLIRVPVVGGTDQPTVRLSRVSTINSGRSTVQSPAGFSENAILDTGTTLTVLPKSLVDNVIEAMGARFYPNSDADPGITIIPCSQRNKDLSTSFRFAGPAINVDISQLVLESLGTLDGVEMCQFGLFASDGSYPTTLGATFLRSAYVLYDVDNNRVGLAQTVVNAAAAARLVALSEDGSVDGVVA